MDNNSNAGGSDLKFKAFASGMREQKNIMEIMNWISFFEDEYNCTGICKAASFYWSKSIELGKPTISCIKGLKDGISKAFLGIGICAIVAGGLLWFVWIC